MTNLSEIQNFLQISPLLATAGQPRLDQFPIIREAGYQLVINLALPDSWDAVPGEADLVQSLGLRHISIPVIWENPTLEDLAQFFAEMQENQDKAVFVHCARNFRVSVFTYLYRSLQLKVPEAGARLDLEKIWQPNENWQAFIDRAKAQYAGQ